MLRRLFAGSWPGWRVIAWAALAGAMMAAGQAPLGWWWLAMPALAWFVRLVATATTGAGWIALFGGAAYFAASLNWIIEPFLIDAQRYGWMAPFAVAFLCFGLALFWGAAGWMSAKGGHRGFAFAGWLALAELARGYVLTGFPWALIGHIWIDHAPAQVAALIGPSGLTLLTLVAAALIACVRPVQVGGGVALLGAMAAFGMWRLDQPDPAPSDVMLRLVQPNATQRMKWDPVEARRFFDRQLDFTARDPLPDLTIWPETAVPYLLEDHPEVAQAIAVAGRGSPVAVGIQRTDGWPFWNSMAVIAPSGTVSAIYDKHHLVPFGEYIPFGDLAQDWLGLRAFAARSGNGYTAGKGPTVLDLGPELGKVLPLICYEAVFPQDLRTPERPDWILQITNDAWFGTLTGPYQHFAQARLRAVEQGLPLIRVANTGVTAVIDAKGRVVADLALGEVGYLDAALPGALPATPYSRYGEWPVLVLLVGLGALVLLHSRHKSA
ncbi:MAG: apolipoprotein N-acyltransferase [Pseudomonadota bacterium]